MAETVLSLFERGKDDEFVLSCDNMPESIFGQHAQAAVEKYIKSLLFARDGIYPFIHDLERLHRLLTDKPTDVLPISIEMISDLTDYALQVRYDDTGEIDPLDRDACKKAVSMVREYVERRLRELGKL